MYVPVPCQIITYSDCTNIELVYLHRFWRVVSSLVVLYFSILLSISDYLVANGDFDGCYTLCRYLLFGYKTACTFCCLFQRIEIRYYCWIVKEPRPTGKKTTIEIIFDLFFNLDCIGNLTTFWLVFMWNGPGGEPDYSFCGQYTFCQEWWIYFQSRVGRSYRMYGKRIRVFVCVNARIFLNWLALASRVFGCSCFVQVRL